MSESDERYKRYLMELGFHEYQADYIVAGRNAPDDMPTEEEWIQMSDEEREEYVDMMRVEE